MKKVHRMIRILAVAVVLLFTGGCQITSEHAEEKKATGQMAEVVTFSETPETPLSDDIEKQLQIILDNKKKWMENEDKSVPYLTYAVTDLDQNGRLEILASAPMQGSGRFTYTFYYQVNKKKNGLQKMNNGLGADWTQAEDIVSNMNNVYYDKKTDVYWYLSSDSARISMQQHYYAIWALSLQGNKIKRKHLGTEYMLPNKKNTKSVKSYYKTNQKTGKLKKVSKKEFGNDVTLADEVFSKCGKMSANIKWFSFERKIKKITEEQMCYYLKSSYRAFSLGEPLFQKKKTISGFSVNVPQYKTMADEEKQKRLNRLIVKEIEEKLDVAEDFQLDTFQCQVKKNTKNRLSILVEVEGYGESAAHPFKTAYTVNIDCDKVSVLSQTDMLPKEKREQIEECIMAGNCDDVRDLGYRKLQIKNHGGKLLADEAYWEDVELYEDTYDNIGIVIPTAYALGSYQIYEPYWEDDFTYEEFDWGAYKYHMSGEEYEALQQYAPVLLNKSSFRLSKKTGEEKDVTISQFFAEWNENILYISFCDINGDKEKEVAIDFFTDFYATLILAKNESGYYGYFSDHMLETENGIFSSFEGDDETDICDVYYRLTFQNGKWYMTELARDGELYIGEKSKSYYRLNGKDVTEDEYDEWLGKEWEDVPKHYEPISKERTAY